MIVIKSALKDFSAGMDIKEHTPDMAGGLLSELAKLTGLLLQSKTLTIEPC